MITCSPYSPRAARAGSKLVGSPSRAWTKTPGLLASPPAGSPPTSSGSVAVSVQEANSSAATVTSGKTALDHDRAPRGPPALPLPPPRENDPIPGSFLRCPSSPAPATPASRVDCGPPTPDSRGPGSFMQSFAALPSYGPCDGSEDARGGPSRIQGRPRKEEPDGRLRPGARCPRRQAELR